MLCSSGLVSGEVPASVIYHFFFELSKALTKEKWKTMDDACPPKRLGFFFSLTYGYIPSHISCSERFTSPLRCDKNEKVFCFISFS